MTRDRPKRVFIFTVIFTVICSAFYVSAKENIIQEEMMSYDRCLTVISTSEDKLLIAPEISDESNQKRVAVFKLTDGTLTITCDGQLGVVRVSTKMD